MQNARAEASNSQHEAVYQACASAHLLPRGVSEDAHEHIQMVAICFAMFDQRRCAFEIKRQHCFNRTSFMCQWRGGGGQGGKTGSARTFKHNLATVSPHIFICIQNSSFEN